MKKQSNTKTPFRTFLISGKIYNSEEFIKSLSKEDFPIIKSSDKIEYYNIPCGLDIETSSFYSGPDKRSIMYEWTLGIFDKICIGRTWDDLLSTINKISELFATGTEKRLVIYIHNLAYEFQFIAKRFDFIDVFSLDIRKPVRAITSTGIEFRCSYKLSGTNLAEVGKHLIVHKVEKMSGDLDYSLIRHSSTPLTERETQYCYNDVAVILSYIMEKIKSGENICRIPMTKTGYVRQYCRNRCMYSGSHKKDTDKYFNYSAIMRGLSISTNEYRMLKAAFQGGFTHANAYRVERVCENVKSFDLTSSYPSVMVLEKFPMSKGEGVKISCQQEFENNIKKYCCVFNIRFHGLVAKTTIDNPLSVSKCRKVIKSVIDNGRVVSAESLETTLTEIDYGILSNFYKWDSVDYGMMIRYRKAYLPADFIKAILDLYEDKTTLKGVDGEETQYLLSKEMINSVYGMCVTDIARDTIKYDGEWEAIKPNMSEVLEKYNGNKRRFLFYPWGVWVTAYARRNLFSGIKACGEDYIYSDTDSLKILNYEKHKDYIKNYNGMIVKKIEASASTNSINIDKYMPMTKNGEKKIIGIWDDDGMYTKFKTLGAKRYMVEYENINGELEVNLTISGVNKKVAIPYLLNKYGKNIFKHFTDGLLIPEGATGKNTLTYIDDYTSGEVTDYLGSTIRYEEYGSIHMEGASYEISLAREFVDYLKGIKFDEY